MTFQMKTFLMLMGILISSSSFSQQIRHEFKSPSFSGTGIGAHYLTIENQERTRQRDIEKRLEDELKSRIAAEENSTLNRFLRNVESRIYSELSRQLVTSLFSSGGLGDLPGEIFLQGYTIRYVQDVDDDGFEILRLTITNMTDPNDVTTITIPIGAFGGFGP
jgi:hypothetical protein